MVNAQIVNKGATQTITIKDIIKDTRICSVRESHKTNFGPVYLTYFYFICFIIHS